MPLRAWEVMGGDRGWLVKQGQCSSETEYTVSSSSLPAESITSSLGGKSIGIGSALPPPPLPPGPRPRRFWELAALACGPAGGGPGLPLCQLAGAAGGRRGGPPSGGRVGAAVGGCALAASRRLPGPLAMK